MSEDRLLFVADHATRLEEVKRLAEQLQAETAQKAESERKLAVHRAAQAGGGLLLFGESA